MKTIIYRLILINDFLKFNSSVFPNDNFVKIAIKLRFKAKIIKKNGNDRFVKNNGTIIDENEVAITHA